MAKTIELMLTDNVENLGIVGDVVRVKPGYARNFLLPRELATEPTEQLRQELADRRAAAEREVAQRRQQQADMVGKLEGYELTLERSCNDQGLLYGSVTQQDIASSLNEQGYEVRPRDVRLSHTVKRIDSYDVVIKPQNDLEATIKLWVVADRKIEVDEREEMEFDNEGNLIERPNRPERAAEAPAEPDGEAAQADADPDNAGAPAGDDAAKS